MIGVQELKINKKDDLWNKMVNLRLQQIICTWSGAKIEE